MNRLENLYRAKSDIKDLEKQILSGSAFTSFDYDKQIRVSLIKIRRSIERMEHWRLEN